jgi:hypothetical protein
MLILILVALWLVLLAPAFVKKHLENRSTVSIDSFHRSLHLLERTGPKLVAPAYRLETAHAATGVVPGQSGLPAVSSMPGRPNLVLLQPVGDDPAATDGDDVVDDAAGRHYLRVPPQLAAAPGPSSTGPSSAVGPSGIPPTLAARSGEYRTEQARRRRRDILFALGGTVVLTAPLGAVHGLHLLWVVTVLAGVALAAYVGLAAYAQALDGTHRMPAPNVSYRYADDVDRRSAAVHGFPGAWDDEPVSQSTPSHWAAMAGYPGAWDDELADHGHDGWDGHGRWDGGYEEPRRAAGG